MGNLYPTIPPTGPQQGYPPYQSQGMAPPPAYYPGTHTAPPAGFGPPPVYSASPNTSMGGAPLGQPTYSHQPQAYPQQQTYPQQAAYPQTAIPPQPQPMVAAKFDAGARFHKNAPASIPPPPPGVMPNAAQVAAMQGQSVVMGKKEEGFLKGSGSGGYTFW